MSHDHGRAPPESRIARDPNVLAGKPVVRGTRLSVEFLLGLMAAGWSMADILASYPALTQDNLSACLSFARQATSTP
jgi:uncharacterized protein (DUF433 family)